jgi:hypothetical protein
MLQTPSPEGGLEFARHLKVFQRLGRFHHIHSQSIYHFSPPSIKKKMLAKNTPLVV